MRVLADIKKERVSTRLIVVRDQYAKAYGTLTEGQEIKPVVQVHPYPVVHLPFMSLLVCRGGPPFAN